MVGNKERHEICEQRETERDVSLTPFELQDTYHIEDGVHHSRHGNSGATAARKEERIGRVSELSPHVFFDFLNGELGLFPDFLGEIARRLIGLTQCRCKGETGWDIDPHAAHFLQTKSLAAEDVLVRVWNGLRSAAEADDIVIGRGGNDD